VRGLPGSAHRRFCCLLAACALSPASATADVHPDCFDAEWGVTCFKDRVEDAKLIDAVLAPALARLGWERACYLVQYVKGDNGGPDLILVSVQGAMHEHAPTCTRLSLPGDPRERSRGTGSRELRRIAERLKKALLDSPKAVRTKTLRNLREITVVDGRDHEGSAGLR
jgi:hypothetical protein